MVLKTRFYCIDEFANSVDQGEVPYKKLPHQLADMLLLWIFCSPTALRKAKTVYNFGLSECNRVIEDTNVYNFGLSTCNMSAIG